MPTRPSAEVGGNDPQGTGLPVRRLTTTEDRDHLQLAPAARQGLDRLVAWLRQPDRPERGIRALFCGPRGSGKTLAAALLGKATGVSAYRIDLAAIISKYIGETEKNLDRWLDQAGREGSILFFDEADALSSGGAAADAGGDHVRRAVSDLWQRIEDSPGVVILASHCDADPDETLSRRVRWVVHFPAPRPAPE